MKKLSLLTFLLCIFQFSGFAQVSESMIIGVWTPGHGKARVQIEKIKDKYYGKTVWLKEPNDPTTGKPKVDVNNPEVSLRSRPRLGLTILKDFVYDGDGVFKDGTVYDPESGKTYCGKITIKSATTLDMRGSICSFKLLGRTDTWTKYNGK